jgi:hypothetical protein
MHQRESWGKTGQSRSMDCRWFPQRCLYEDFADSCADEVGPYAKGALLDGGHVPQIAGGAVVGYRFGAYEVLVNTGLGYATERIGSTASPDSGQTKLTYDLGLSLRYDINNQYFLSGGYAHNSNGHALGLDFISGKGANPGIDSWLIGAGVHF